jgi:hypothetical protein
MLGSLPGGRPNAFDIASPIDRVSGPTGQLLFVTAKPVSHTRESCGFVCHASGPVRMF